MTSNSYIASMISNLCKTSKNVHVRIILGEIWK